MESTKPQIDQNVAKVIFKSFAPGVKYSPQGDAYIVGLFETDQKQTGSFLACEKRWNLGNFTHKIDHFSELKEEHSSEINLVNDQVFKKDLYWAKTIHNIDNTSGGCD